MQLTNRFTEECIEIDSKESTKEKIIESMVNKLCDVYEIENREGVLEAVLHREKKMSTGIGCGLAVPHSKVDFLDNLDFPE